MFGGAVLAPPPGEYVADGAARQAAWVLSGSASVPVCWEPDAPVERYDGEPTPGLRERYAQGAERYLNRDRSAER